MGINLMDILGGGTLGAVNNIIKDFKGDPNAKNQLAELVQQNEAQFKLADLQAQVQLNQIASDNLKADAQSASWLARNARPYFLFMGTNLIFFNYLVPLLGQHWHVVPIDLPPLFYKIFCGAFLGYVAGRSTEKILNADN